jgi:hypothetical protein
VITYKDVCEKLGFDPITDDVELHTPGHEADSAESPFAKLSAEELSVLAKHLIANRGKLERYMVK